MKVTRRQASAMIRYCRTHGVEYQNKSSYPNALGAALRADIRVPNGMLIHLPRDFKDGAWENPRAYVCWFGEPIEQVEEALAYLVMTSKRTEFYVLRCVSLNGRRIQEEIEGASVKLIDKTDMLHQLGIEFRKKTNHTFNPRIIDEICKANDIE